MLLTVIATTAALAPAPAHAEPQVWSALLAQGQPSPDGGVVGWFDAHARRRGDGLLAIVRPGLGYDLGGGLAVHAGYAWIPLAADEGDSKTEHRSWQQLLWNYTVSDALKVQVRPRLEQRFGAGDDLGHRTRVFLRGQWAPSASLPMQLVVWDELFVQLNDTDWNLRRGFDQNRAFAGVGTDTALRGVRVEAGYLNVAFRDRVDHVVAVNLLVRIVPAP